MPAAQLLQLQQGRRRSGHLTLGPLPLPRLGHQPLGQGGGRGGEQLLGGGLLDQAALVQHGDLVAPAACKGQVVADQQQGAARFAAKCAELPHHLAGDGHIQAGGGLVGDHQGRIEGHGQGDRQPLTHAAAEFMGVAAVALGVDPDPGQQLLGPFSHLAPPPAGAVGGQGVPQVVANGQ